MAENETENLLAEIKIIDKKVKHIECKIEELENEKGELLELKRNYTALVKQLTPSSLGGFQDDSTSKWNKTDFEWNEKVFKCLKETFKLASFRPLQFETINVTLSKQDCMVIMPTGGGKSLCFQLPAVIDTGLTLVVSPLISLIEDQLWILSQLKIRSCTLNSNIPKEEAKKIEEEIFNNEYSSIKILYVTPEKLAKSKRFMNKLEKLYEQNRFARLVIDEVHCCSTYGHDFRPDYKFLGIMKRQFPNVPILGLTATATTNVIDDLKKILNLQNCILFKSSFNRPNIFYEVRQKPSNHEECMNEIANLIKNQFAGQSGIVYCFSQKDSEEIAAELRRRSIKADCYHANLPQDFRSRVHDNWIKNKTLVIVATIAFGMGIDKAAVRFVIHHSMSKSLENFYQESGRAGRDNLPANSILYYKFSDIFRQSGMVFTEQTGLENLYSMVNYCIDQTICKRKIIAQHFNESSWSKDGTCNQMCDYCKYVCNKSSEQVNLIEEARVIVQVLEKQSLKDKGKRITANKLAELSFEELKKKAITRQLSLNDVEKLIINMITKFYLKEDFHFTPYNTICYVIKDALASELNKLQFFYMRLSDSSYDKTCTTSTKTTKTKTRISNDCEDDDNLKNVKKLKK